MSDGSGGLSVSRDAQALMAFEANKKSMGVTYLLWLFLGGLGAHRFYLGKSASGLGILALSVLGWLTLFVGIGAVFLIVMGIWVLVDAFLIPGYIRSHNTLLMAKLSSSPSPLAAAAIG
ncbi:NINE protein [Phenylobacterium sp.]|jgi:TM2 domain-containing membrane protein YozV|uniref:NINE protein n=1 Tax=Phenylobacterium sp. TaxID=1871053 RepID=UPI002F950586